MPPQAIKFQAKKAIGDPVLPPKAIPKAQPLATKGFQAILPPQLPPQTNPNMRVLFAVNQQYDMKPSLYYLQNVFAIFIPQPNLICNTMKAWQSEEKNDDKIIAYFDSMIYIINPKPADVQQVILDMEQDRAPTKNFTSVPMRYVRKIELEDGKNYIVVYFGKDSYQHLRVKDAAKRQEIFNYFKTCVPGTRLHTDRYSAVRAGKAPLFAMCAVAGIFAYTMYIASGMEQGNEYTIVGKPFSLAGMVLSLASLGTAKVTLIFGSLFAIAATSFVLKARNPKVVEQILIRE